MTTTAAAAPRRSDIEFELWKRSYYPNIREQLIGKVTSIIVLDSL